MRPLVNGTSQVSADWTKTVMFRNFLIAVVLAASFGFGCVVGNALVPYDHLTEFYRQNGIYIDAMNEVEPDLRRMDRELAQDFKRIEFESKDPQHVGAQQYLLWKIDRQLKEERAQRSASDQ